MNWVVVIVFAVIILAVLAKHWDKFAPVVESLFSWRRNRKSRQPIEIDRRTFKEFKTGRVNELIEKRERLLQKIEDITRESKEELREIDFELAMIQGGER